MMDLIYLNEVGSTNLYLRQYVKDNASVGHVAVYTDNQLSGYGKRQRPWHTKKGQSLAISLLTKARPLATPLCAVAVCDVLQNFGLTTKIKWPNDIMINEKKLCGILCEAFAGYIIMGIGINVNNEGFPRDIADIATSMYLETGDRFYIHDIAKELTQTIFYSDLGEGDIISRYSALCKNIGHYIKLKDKDVEGEAVGINPDGHILIKAGSVVRAYSSGEII